MEDNSFRLITLGRLALVDPFGAEDASINKRRRKLALCAVLAMADRPMSRDVLVELFWGEQEPARARHSLADALSHLRRILGRDAITTRQAEVSLAEGAPLVVDAVTLAAAAADRDHERASALYRGRFFDGAYLGGSARLEQWVGRERARLESIFLQCCERQCLVLARARRWGECAELAGRWLDAAPLSSSAALFRLNAIKASGGAEADRQALDEYERLAERIAREHRLRPDPAVAALAADIASRVAAAIPTVSSPPPSGSPVAVRSAGVQVDVPPVSVATAPPPLQPGSRIQSGAELAAALASHGPVRHTVTRARWIGGVAAVLALLATGVVVRRDVVQATPSELTRSGPRPGEVETASRLTDWNQLHAAAFGAFRNGEHTRSEALGRALIERYPNDPRAYALLGDIYFHHGRWDAAERVMRARLAVDSVGAAGSGDCASCGGRAALAALLMERGDMAGAERLVRRMLELEPGAGGGWNTLSAILAAQGKLEASMEAQRRAVALLPGDAYLRGRIGRTFIIMRRYDAADSVIRELARDSSPAVRRQAFDLRFMLQRERGQFRASNATIDSMLAEFPDTRELQLVQGSNLGRLGDHRGARRLYETLNHTVLRTTPSSPTAAAPPGGDHASAFCWHHTLEADAIAAGGDTVLLRVLADSIEQESGRSYYARDWKLHHHVRGLIAMQQRRYEDAARDFEQARWGGHGFTRTLAELARAQLALGRPHDAIATLRAVYLAPLDAMGRYLPRSEADFLMWRAFEQTGTTDSAAVYEAYVRTAWANADAEMRRRITPPAPGRLQ